MKISAERFWEVWIEKVAPKLDERFDESYSSDPKWTEVIFSDEILEIIKSELGIDARKEDFKTDTVFAGHENLIYEDKDKDWFYPKERLILFEHENKIDTVVEEVYKLLYRRAPLKVIVTYQYNQPDMDYEADLKERIEKYAGIITRSNTWFPENPETEYLFIVGRRDDERKGILWLAHVIDTKGRIRFEVKP